MRKIVLFAFTLILTATAVSTAAVRRVVTTQQSVSYDLPDGWTVDRWTGKTGEAILKNTKTGDVMFVERYGVSDTPPTYANKENVGSDRTFSWKYAEGILTPADFTLSANVSFADAKLAARISIGVSSPEFKGVNKDAALAATRTVASSVKILGPRQCWPPGECPPGTVKEIQ